MNSIIDNEYKRLKSLFSLVDESKTELVDNLIYQAAFMKVELDKLQEQIRKYGAIQISNKGMQRQTEVSMILKGNKRIIDTVKASTKQNAKQVMEARYPGVNV